MSLQHQPLTSEQQQLVSENIGIALAVLKRMHVHQQGWEEARDEAFIALCLAAQTFDPTKGCTFTGWAWRKVKWHVSDWMQKENRARRLYEDNSDCVPTNGRTAQGWIPEDIFPLDRFHQQAALDSLPDTTPLADATTYDHQVEEAVTAALASSPKLTRDIATQALKGTTNAEMATLLGCSRETVVRRRRVIRETLTPLREIISKDRN